MNFNVPDPSCPSKLWDGVIHHYIDPVGLVSWREIISKKLFDISQLEIRLQDSIVLSDSNKYIQTINDFSFEKSELSFAGNELIQAFYSDTLLENPFDSIIPFLKEGIMPDWEKDLTFAYFSQGDLLNTELMLGKIGKLPENAEFLSMFHVLISMAKDSSFEQVLVTDSSLQAEVRSLAKNTNSREGTLALSLLKQVFWEDFSVWVEPDKKDTSARLAHQVENQQNTEQDNSDEYFSLNPNPANEKILLTYQFKSTETNLKAVVFDITGRKIFEVPLTQVSGILEWSTASLQAGIYFCSVEGQEKNVRKTRFVIIK